MVIHVSGEQVPSLRFPINSNYQSRTERAPTSKMMMMTVVMVMIIIEEEYSDTIATLSLMVDNPR